MGSRIFKKPDQHTMRDPVVKKIERGEALKRNITGLG